MIVNGRLTALNINHYNDEVELCLTVITKDDKIKSAIYHLPCDIELKITGKKRIRYGDIEFKYNVGSKPEIWDSSFGKLIANFEYDENRYYNLRFINNRPFDANPDDFWHVAKEAQEYLDSLS